MKDMAQTPASKSGEVGCTVLSEQQRRQYAPPRLIVFGVVSELTQGTRTRNNDGGNTRLNMSYSDRALKENIVRVGVHPLGMGLYLFDYKPESHATVGCGRQFGVMADEVEAVMPDAVVMYADGYKRVDYAMLGIDLSARREL
jgi:hypothetical protein